jgi:hypothetical protein
MTIDSMTEPFEDNFISIYPCDRLASSLLAVDMGDLCGLRGNEDYEGESQGIENGGPYVPGDTVRIIAGKHRGTVARVYGTGQHETVRVELGEAAKEQYADFYSTYELVRETADEQNAETELPDTGL